LDLARPGHARVMGATVEGTVRFYVLADNPAAAMLASRGECVDRALKAVEHVLPVAGHGYLKRLRVFNNTRLHT
jgi:hypothetical protein